MASVAETTTINDHSACDVEDKSRATAPPRRNAIAPIYTLSDIFLYVVPVWGLITAASVLVALFYIKK